MMVNYALNPLRNQHSEHIPEEKHFSSDSRWTIPIFLTLLICKRGFVEDPAWCRLVYIYVMCICLCIFSFIDRTCVHTCINIKQTHVCMYIYIYMCVCMCVCVCTICTCVNIHSIHIHMHTRISFSLSLSIYIYISTHANIQINRL